MNIFKYLVVLAFALLCASCSNLPFNERYAGANWKKIIIAPFTGELAENAEFEFEHALAISMTIEVVPASISKMAIKKHGLEEEFSNDPNNTMIKLAELLNADGVIFGDIHTVERRKTRSMNLSTSSARFSAKLVDVRNNSIVASSLQESSSLFSNEYELLQEITQESTNEFKVFFDELNPEKEGEFSFSKCFSLCS
jgi:hypothetical protein